MKTIGIVVNPSKELTKKLLPELIGWFQSRKIEVFVAQEQELDYVESSLFVSCEKIAERSDFIIAMGGDGTLLRAARYIMKQSIPLIGINLGSLGFLTEIVVDELYPTLEKILEGDYKIEKRTILKASLDDKRTFFALNDIVLHMGHLGRIIGIKIRINGNPLAEFSADGLIISTPTGSTAYSLAAGGPIIHHGVDAQVLTPICPHTLGLRPMVFSSSEKLTIELQKGSGIFVVDGQTTIDVKKGFRFTVTQADYKVSLVRATKRDFFEILRTKLNWGGL
jgi:NAD+ kinase